MIKKKNHWIGKHHTKETKIKMSEARKGKKLPKETKKKMSLARKGFKMSDESKKKIGKSKKGNTYWKGKKHTKETKKILSAIKQGISLEEWNGFSSIEPYPVDWTKTLKRSIRERDKYSCKLCGKPQEDRAFDVHHIDYNKKNCNEYNLISLCSSCHSKTNFNRNDWKKHYSIKMIEV